MSLEFVYMAPTLIMLFFSDILITPFNEDRKCTWNKFQKTLYISNKKVVLSRYISCMIILLISLTLGELSTITIALMNDIKIKALMILMPYIALCILLIILFIQLPLLYKYDNDMVAHGVIIAFAVILSLISVFIFKDNPEILKNISLDNIFIKTILILSPVILAGLGYLSVNLSSKFYSGREF